ncbi:uncharacterized protein LOC124452060 [Xenia sp. Carnegie-2017]|uniref:uncharacterized protein LOC124452060 n=1 Tax=Xenia sp. Carnegie-2017 TaxID=2897299 RepID=UPI001F03A9B1|nr:uncharacterized protein LOC124452060 [Xenia sp. Carnegie-2017]
MGSFWSSDKKTNGFKLMRLIVDVGGEALRITLRKQLSGSDMGSFWSSDKKTNGLKLMRLIVDVGGEALRITLRKQLSAMQVSRNFPAYKQLLVKKLSGQLSEPLNNMNVEGLFSLLFTELCVTISGLPKRILVVLDALDECGYPERDDLTYLLANHLHKLPPCFRFVVTTRPNEVALNKFEKLNPLFINCSDDRNLEDIKFLMEQRIGATDSLLDVRNILVEKVDGLMLLASLLTSEVKSQDLLNASIPKDLNEYYEICLTRLSKELDSFDISNEMFQSILNALAVAKEPLPWKMINDVLCLNSSRESLRVRKIISCLFVTNEEGCVSFFHKSLYDWLLDDREHNYSVKTSCGHRLVLEFCLKSLDNLKAEGVNYDVIKHVSVRYSVKYWLLHLLDISDNDYIVENVCKYLVDLEVLVASVLVDSRRTFKNFKLFNAHDVYFLISEDIRLLFNEVYSVMTYSSFSDNEVKFLQYVANVVKDLSSQATTMLQTRFEDSPYLEYRDTGFVKARLLRLRKDLISVDVSRNHDYVVCGYEGFIVQLFSLRTNRCLWIKKIAGQFELFKKVEFCVVFYPFKDLIFASQLDKILDINGKISSSPFHCDDSTSKFFTNKCFSKDKYTMVTSYKDTLTVWDVEKGEKQRSIRFNNVTSLCFSNSGKYLCVIEERKVIQIFDVASNYETFVYDDHIPSSFLIVFAVLFPVGLHSWCCCWHPLIAKRHFIVNPSAEFNKLLNNYAIDITCVQEDRFVHADNDPDIVIRNIGLSVLFTSTASRSSIGASIHGVGIAINAKLVPFLESVDKHDNRTISSILKGNPKTIVVACYSPHNVLDEPIVSDFYQKLSQVIEDVLSHSMLFVGGDMNAQVDTGVSYHSSSNLNGFLLFHFIQQHNLLIGNTLFQKKQSQLWSNRSPSGSLSQIDLYCTANGGETALVSVVPSCNLIML